MGKKNKKNLSNGLSKSEIMVTVVAEIIAELIKADRQDYSVDLNRVGTRHYYRKLGYQLDGPYMSKCL
ncbi:hypothetical protein DERP_000948 [Dermatophagoides pteronyssinus]|uniref:Uncharacterized protein n=1 Tax=Dermatophagoides pteronyssinus TaxID=6956 RepID=A0ABQ8JDL4_DERPT|nr:hypothetical protein DERP_000948 [Dermatophagoides pteronyssinus]